MSVPQPKSQPYARAGAGAIRTAGRLVGDFSLGWMRGLPGPRIFLAPNVRAR